jgi:hypothetical protein
MAKRRSSINEQLDSLEPEVEKLTEEVRVLRQAIDEFRVDFTHLLRNLPDNLPPPYGHLATLAESFGLEHVIDHDQDATSESLCCHECDTDSPSSVAQALHDGWIDISCAEEAYGTTFVGWCPSCQKTYDEEHQRLSAGRDTPQPVKETKPASANPKTLFD